MIHADLDHYGHALWPVPIFVRDARFVYDFRTHGPVDPLRQGRSEKIRAAAMRERRTLSGYVLHVILNRIASQEKTCVYAPARRSSRY